MRDKKISVNEWRSAIEEAKRPIDLSALAAQVKRVDRALVFITHLAEFLGEDKDKLNHYVRRKKFVTFKVYDLKSQRMSIAIDPDDTVKLLQMRAEEGYPLPGLKNK